MDSMLQSAPVVRRARRWPWAMLMVVAMVAGLLGFAAPASANSGGDRSGSYGALHQADVAIPVHVDGDATTYQVHGKLGWRGTVPDRDEPVQILLAGLSYDHNYWDFPFQDGRYSYVSAATHVSVTYNFDQLGTSYASDHPPMAELSLVEQAKVADQVVMALRSGVWVQSGYHRFRYQAHVVFLVGHSLGGEQALVEASLFPTHVDGVINTDYLHTANQAGVNAVGAVRVPANSTAKYQSATWAANAVTTADGPTAEGQRSVFYYGLGADPRVIARDESLKAVSPMATALQAQYIRTTDPGLTDVMTVPLLVAVGQYDSLNCNDPSSNNPALDCSSGAVLVQREEQYYPGIACARGYVEPDSGHDMNLHKNAPLWFAAANRWVVWMTILVRTNHSHQPVRC